MENESFLLDLESLPVGSKLYAYVLICVIGLFFGSFLYCLAERLVTGESYTKGRSHCENCGHVLSAMDLIPVLSWFVLNGKCRYCGIEISSKYPISEIITAICYAAVLSRFKFTLETIEFLVLVSILLCISFADIEQYIIPDGLIIAGIINRIIFILSSENILSTLLTSLLGGIVVTVPVLIIVLIMEKILKKEAMGGGDIKLFFMTGLYFTWTQNILALLISCFAGIIYGVISMKKSNSVSENESEKIQNSLIPFGPFIAFGSFATMLFGEKIISMYLSLF